LQHPLAQVASVPSAWPSVIRQPVRNDYPLLSCLELGVQTVSVPATDLAEPLQKERLAYLREEGLEVNAAWLWAGTLDLAKAVQPYQEQFDNVELQLLGVLWPDEACLQALQACQAQTGLPAALCPVIPRERVPGKQHQRTRFGYRVAELADLERHLAQHQAQLGRAVCRVDAGVSPWETMRQQAKLSHIEAIDWRVEFATVDEQEQVKRAAEALFAAALWPKARLFLEPLVDLDRTMDISYGLLDRLCNPRPVFQVVRCLNTLLFAHPEPRSPLAEPVLEGVRALGLSGPTTTLWLLLPAGPAPVPLDLSKLKGFADSQARHTYWLVSGAGQVLSGSLEGKSLFPVTEATLLKCYSTSFA
jgi:hypothetical protein